MLHKNIFFLSQYSDKLSSFQSNSINFICKIKEPSACLSACDEFCAESYIGMVPII